MSEKDKYNTESIIKEMALLYANSKEIVNLLNNELSEKDIQPSKYYLLPKDWLDQYEKQFGYLSVTSNINPYIISDYSNFKNQILKDKKYFSSCISNVSIQIENTEVIPPVPYELKNLTSSYIQNIIFPLDFYPIKEDIINEYTCQNFDFNNKNLFLYEIIITDDNILAIDNNNKLNIFVCKYNVDKNCFNPCSLFSFQEEIGLSEMIKCACNRNGMSNYYKLKNINEDGEIEQEINDAKGSLIGSFTPFKGKIRNDEGKTVLFKKGDNGNVSFKASLNMSQNISEEHTTFSNQITASNSNNTESIKNSTIYKEGGNGNTLIIDIEKIKNGEINFPSINDSIFSNEDIPKSNKIKENKSLDTIKEENMDDSQSINPNVSYIKKSKKSLVKSNVNQKKYIYNIMGDIYYYSYISKNNNHQSNSKSDIIVSDIENINEKKVNKINHEKNLNNNKVEEKQIFNPMAFPNQQNNNINWNTCYNNNILKTFDNSNIQIMNNYNNQNMDNFNYIQNNGNFNDQNLGNIINNQNMGNFINNQNMGNINNQNMGNINNNQNMGNFNNDQNMGNINNCQNMGNFNNQNMGNINNQNMGNFNNQSMGNINNNQNMGNFNNQNIDNFNINQNMGNCNDQNMINYNGNQNINNNNMGNCINCPNMNGSNNNPYINNFNNQNIDNQKQNYDNWNGNQNSNMGINDFNQNQNMNYLNLSTYNNGNENVNNGNTNIFNSNTNYINQNNNLKKFTYNLKESNNPDKNIILTMSTPQFNQIRDLEVKISQNLNEIIQSQKWLNPKNIYRILFDNRILNLNQTLLQQGLINNSKIDIYFGNN